MKPIDIPTRETTTFVSTHVRRGSTLLEIGCGDGDVAAALSRNYDVVAIDPDADAVARARQRGVNATRASWPDFETAPVDAVVFTRSLHHMHELDGAIARAREVLKPGGRVLVEDFAFEEADAATVRWFADTATALRSNFTGAPHEFVMQVLAARDPLSAWHRDHDHELHPAGAMIRAIGGHFETVETKQAPYLYRYFVPVLPLTEPAVGVLESVLQQEVRLAECGKIQFIGRRIAGSGHG